MKRLIAWTVLLAVLGLAAVAAGIPALNYLKERQRVAYREVDVSRGRIVAVVNSTGTVQPVRSVLVGAAVSGPIKDIFVNFNDEVKKGDLLARIDPLIFDANVARDKAALATRHAELERAKALLQQAKNDESRARALRAENKNFLSDAELDQYVFNRISLEAQVVVAETNVDQAVANLKTSDIYLAYTEIRSPEDGIVIDRKVDPGQTVAASFQTPDLFVVAPDMKKEMLVFASVDEADIGMIRLAKEAGQPVHFTVDAWPDELFTGKITQIRQSATTTQNVVTYPVVVSAANPDLKLINKMTASVSFQLKEMADVLRVPNAALRFFPAREQVRPEDRAILDSKTPAAGEVDEQAEKMRSAEEKAELRRKRQRRHIWVVDGDFLRAVEITTGISDNNYTEIVAGELREGQKVVTGLLPRT
jgi:HlyD family secretion protein